MRRRDTADFHVRCMLSDSSSLLLLLASSVLVWHGVVEPMKTVRTARMTRAIKAALNGCVEVERAVV